MLETISIRNTTVCGAHSIDSDHELERESNNALEKYLALDAKTLKANVLCEKRI